MNTENTQSGISTVIHRMTEMILRKNKYGFYPEKYTLAQCLSEADGFRFKMAIQIIILIIGLIIAWVRRLDVARFILTSLVLLVVTIIFAKYAQRVYSPGKKVLAMAKDAIKISKKIRCSDKSFLKLLEEALPSDCISEGISNEELWELVTTVLEQTLMKLVRELKDHENTGQEYQRASRRRRIANLYKFGIEIGIPLKEEREYFDNAEEVAAVN